jgi:hypothetical protein
LEKSMPVVKLTSEHTLAVRNIFNHSKYMGVDSAKIYQVANTGLNALTYDIFCANYLSDLNNYHSFGYVEDGIVKALISFYESVEEPSWFYTLYRSTGNNNLLREVLDEVIKYNESNGRLKFYTLTHSKHTKLLRRFHWSKYNNTRYGYFDEYLVPAKNKCFYINAWELLYKRLLLPDDSIVRCNYLHQEYRQPLMLGGNL